MEREKIKFKPVHEGMGFHPFSDGLPYAPESKAKYQTGVGATAAGKPQFVTQSFASPAMKTARQIQEAKKVHLPQGASPTFTQPVISTHKPILAKAQPSQAKTASSLSNPASSGEVLRARVFAYLLDSVVHAGFWLSTNFAALIFFNFQIDIELIRENLPQFVLFYGISQWMFISLQEILFGSTIGKAFFKLEFARNHRSLFLRSLVFKLGLICFGLGLYFRPQDRLGELYLRNDSK